MSQNFTNGKIYKITNDYNNEIYIGSTCDTLVKRFSAHKNSINKKNHRPLYNLMEEIGYERFRIELIEDYQCEDKYQLRQREGLWIRQIGTLNIKIAGRTDKEYHKETYNEKKDDILEKKKLYNIENREKIIAYQKEFRINNPEIIKERQKQNYIKNKAKILEKQQEKVICECGCELNKGSLFYHRKSQKHLDLLFNL